MSQNPQMQKYKIQECKKRDSGQYEQRARREANPIVLARPNNSAAVTKSILRSKYKYKHAYKYNYIYKDKYVYKQANPIVVARSNNSAATTESVTPEKSPNILREKIQIQTHIQIQSHIQIQIQTGESNCGGATK